MVSDSPKDPAAPSRDPNAAGRGRSGPKGVNLGKAKKPGAGKGGEAGASGPKKARKPVPPVGEAPVVTKQVLFDRVKARATGIRGNELRMAMDAVLQEIGDALAAGEPLKLPALGNVNVQKRKQLENADIVICKLRRKKPQRPGKDPLAEPVE